ncbi:hypothetical protein GCM10017779_53650 [Streptomyces capillispiralis]|nr:hypothetical protein GCM10017779_53650 [Streptomyces capillispiralis]
MPARNGNAAEGRAEPRDPRHDPSDAPTGWTGSREPGAVGGRFRAGRGRLGGRRRPAGAWSGRRHQGQADGTRGRAVSGRVAVRRIRRTATRCRRTRGGRLPADPRDAGC